MQWITSTQAMGDGWTPRQRAISLYRKPPIRRNSVRISHNIWSFPQDLWVSTWVPLFSQKTPLLGFLLSINHVKRLIHPLCRNLNTSRRLLAVNNLYLITNLFWWNHLLICLLLASLSNACKKGGTTIWSLLHFWHLQISDRIHEWCKNIETSLRHYMCPSRLKETNVE